MYKCVCVCVCVCACATRSVVPDMKHAGRQTRPPRHVANLCTCANDA